jgi:protein-disulfide isomerase
MEEEKKQSLVVPIAIVVAGILIAGTVYFTSTKSGPPSNNNVAATSESSPQQQNINGPKEITSSDHVLGNPDAPLTMVVFTDLECPWCKKFNDVTNQMMSDYGKLGKVKLVLRYFPLDEIHKRTRKEAEATECAADQGGNEKFWQYVNQVFSITPSNDQLDPAQLPKIAKDIGLDQTKFTQCLNSGKFSQKIQDNLDDAIASGGQGTPYFIIIDQKGEKFPFSGYIPYDQLKTILDQILAK